jgi:hypothetical protein
VLQAELVLFPVVLVNVAPITATVSLQVRGGFFARVLESGQSAGCGDYLPKGGILFGSDWGRDLLGVGSPQT